MKERAPVGRLRAALVAGAVLAAVAMPFVAQATPATRAVPGSERLDDPALTAQVAELEALMPAHLFNGQALGLSFSTPERRADQVVGTSGGGDSALWSGVYLAGESFRYGVARQRLADATNATDRAAAQAELAAAKARVDELAWSAHRRIWISGDWHPKPCSPESPPGAGTPRQSCGVVPGEPGAAFRNCFDTHQAPYVNDQSATRHRQVIGPLTWTTGEGADGQVYYCEDASSRDVYAGTTFGLLTAFDIVGPDDAVLRHRIRDDIEVMTDYLVRHGWAVARQHSTVQPEGSENFLFPLFVINPQPRLNMAQAAKHVALVDDPDPAEKAKFSAIYAEQLATWGPHLTTEYELAVESPHNSYYNFNLNHLTNFNVIRLETDPAIKDYYKRTFAIIDKTTRDDINAHFQAVTYALTGEPGRYDDAVRRLRDWITYRATPGQAVKNSDRCGEDLECIPQDEVDYHQDSPLGDPPVPVIPGPGDTTLRSTTPLPVAERPRGEDFLWQRSPYKLDGEGRGNERPPGIDFLTPYWMLRYYTEVAPPALQPFPAYAGPTAGGSARTALGPLGPFATAYTPQVGAMHEHSSYSDGYPGTNPGTYYTSGRKHGLDFMMGGDHSDTFNVPLAASEECLGPNVVTCPGGDPSNPAGTLDKWNATQRYAEAATDASYSAVRGFEWSSDRYGHINVYFSKNYSNAKADGGYASMETFYGWLNRRPEQQGGADGLATFNHPGDKELQGAPQPADFNWNDFAYDAASDARMVGIELYNSGDEYGVDGQHNPPGGYYAHALDKGWHLGPVGAEDLGHTRGDDWGNVSAEGVIQAKTVILSTDRSPAALRAALLARRFYAVDNPDVRLGFSVDGAVMGSRLSRPVGSTLSVNAVATWPGDPDLRLELVTSGGRIVATATDVLSLSHPVAAGERYYFLRVMSGEDAVGYSAPVWVSTAAGPPAGEWLAGDLHVHTCYSHDAYCPPDDYNTTEEDFYTLSGTVEERFSEASVRGLDYLAITDHHDQGHLEESGAQSVNDPGFGTHGVIGVPGYENSISGHAQMLGATKVYPYTSADPAKPEGIAGVIAMADALRADGGVFQANHPADGIEEELTSCAEPGPPDWGYGYRVPVDSVEVWNIGHYLQPPAPGNSPNNDALTYWECWLNTGAHVTATGGSDSHWLSTALVQGPGNPTTWVFARERSTKGVLQAIREGRTSISVQAPAAGATLLLLEADIDGDGVFESMVGDTVPPGTAMRVRATGTPGAGLVEVLGNGTVLREEEPLTPGGTVPFTAPDQAGWVYARLLTPESVETRRGICDQQVGDQTTYCRAPVGVLAMTSAMYLGIGDPSTDVPEAPFAGLTLVLMVATVAGAVALGRRRAARAA